MAITAYTGVSGSGKSYAMMAEIIIPAVRAGRRVLTNLQGVNCEGVVDYVAKKWPDCEPGSVATFEGPETLEAGFFPTPDDPSIPAVLRPGDLFVFDEVRLYWPRRGRFSQDVMRFLRMHRHFVDPKTHQSTDVVFASQIITDFHEDFRGNIERNYKFKKLKAVGLKKRFVWQTWEGSEQRKGQHVGTGGGKYQDAVTALYQSYKGVQGSEKGTDRRENVLAQPKFLLMAVVTVLALFGSMYWIWGFFHPAHAKAKVEAVAAFSVPPAPAGVVGAAAVATVNGAPPVSAVWRISGTIETPGLNVVVLVDRAGNTRYESPGNFTMVDGRPYAGTVDGQRVLAIGMQSASTTSTNIFGGVVK